MIRGSGFARIELSSRTTTFRLAEVEEFLFAEFFLNGKFIQQSRALIGGRARVVSGDFLLPAAYDASFKVC